MSGLQHIERNVKDAFISGEPGTTGREPFENSSASGPGQQFSGSTGGGLESGHHSHPHSHSHTSGQGTGHGIAQAAKNELSSGSHARTGTGAGDSSDLSYGQRTGTGLAGEGGQHSGLTSDAAHHSHHSGSHTHTGTHTGTGLAGAATGAGLGSNEQLGSGRDYREHGNQGVGGGISGAVGHRDHNDRVGHVGQDSAKYEGDLNSGPRTSGAAGTDRFDSDNHRGSGLGAGGVGSGVGSIGDDRKYPDGAQQDTSQRAPGQKSGGLSGLLATSDKDFTGRDRKGEGAYADTDGKFELNSTGPSGNTALTGREGNLDNNPVAQAKSRETGTSTGTGAASTTGEPHKEGFVEKVKHAVGM